MAKSRVVGAVVEEMIGLATMLIPEGKPERRRLPALEGWSEDLAMANIRQMRGMLEEIKSNEAITCPKCRAHVDKIEEELEWLEQRVPTYERVARLRRTLRELLEEVGPGLPLLPEEKLEEKPKTESS